MNSGHILAILTIITIVGIGVGALPRTVSGVSIGTNEGDVIITRKSSSNVQVTSSSNVNVTSSSNVSVTSSSNVQVTSRQQSYITNRHGKKCRINGSAYVSVVQSLPTSMNTRTLLNVTQQITNGKLLPGDIILKPGTHGVGAVPEAATNYPISRDDVITRAKFWSNLGVPYSQTAYHADPDGKEYRTDDSGYVAMVWKLPTYMNIRMIPSFTKPITKNQLLPGDIILKAGTHVVIFDKWVDTAKTMYWAYEQTPPATKYHQINRYPYLGRSGYYPYRYYNIAQTDAASTTTPASTRPCSCPPSPLNVATNNASSSVLCATEMQGTCDPKGLYYCAYLNGWNNNQGSLSTLTVCQEGCYYYLGKSNARCRNEDFQQIMEDAQNRASTGRRSAESGSQSEDVQEGEEVPCDDLQFSGQNGMGPSGALRPQIFPKFCIFMLTVVPSVFKTF